MADTIETKRRIEYELNMENVAGERKTRNIYFDSYDKDTEIAQLKPAVNAIADSLIGGYKTFIQPTGWRDADVTEEAYTTIGVTPKIIDTTEITLDPHGTAPTEKKIPN